ncbi:Ribosomal protein S15P [Penicillium freii]|nr:Ribosomal protein S15P [Penicillium freii]
MPITVVSITVEQLITEVLKLKKVDQKSSAKLRLLVVEVGTKFEGKRSEVLSKKRNKRSRSRDPTQAPSFPSTHTLSLLDFRSFIHADNRPDFLRRTHHQSKMGRLHSKGKGIASSAIPYSRAAPAWLKTTPDQVVDHICKLAKKGATPSQIGVVLRDSHGVAQVKIVTGNKILRILKSSGLAPELPEDLYFLIKKAVAVRKHLERNRKDKDSKFRLILIESRIHRLSRYYKTVSVLPPTWRYESATASTLVA